MRLRKQILTHNNCYTVGRTIRPAGVMVHSTGANNPKVSRYVPGDSVLGWNTGGNHWDQTNAQWEEKFGEPLDRCVHAFIGKWADGKVGTVQTLPWNRRAWHCGKGHKGTANGTHIAFEVCEDGLSDASYFSAVYQEAVELTAYLCKEYGLDPQADGVVICHSEGYRRGIASNHGDVTHWWPRFGVTMDEFRADVAREMQKAGLRIPIMVGGATTSELHVALKIAPEYDGPVIWVKDASLNAGICARFLNEAECPKFEAELRERYEKLRQNYHEEQAKIASLSEARKNKLELF